MSFYDLYGSTTEDLAAMKTALESCLGLVFEEHESGYMGGIYHFAGRDEGEHFELKRNVDPYDDDPAELSFGDCKLLLYVNDTGRAQEIELMIAGARVPMRLLQRREL